MVSKVKNNFKSKTISDKIATTEWTITCMTGNETYTDPNPSLNALEIAKTALHDSAQNAAQGGTTNTAIMYAREKELDDLYDLEVAYVQNRSGGDAEKIRSAGMEVIEGGRSQSVQPEQPQVSANTSTYPGEVLLKWKKPKGAVSYNIEKSADGVTDWIACGSCTQTNKAIGGLSPLTYVWFRVTAVGAAGDSPTSDPVRALAV